MNTDGDNITDNGRNFREHMLAVSKRLALYLGKKIAICTGGFYYTGILTGITNSVVTLGNDEDGVIVSNFDSSPKIRNSDRKENVLPGVHISIVCINAFHDTGEN